ncbi:MAG TPA: hypothetical protein VF736_13565 [Pyrinomonadaceae bacterium]|jgi:hypothetical protein
MAGAQPGDRDFSFFNAVHEVEAVLVESAPEAAGASVTRAAKMPGILHQTFLSMLNTRHRGLDEKRTPPGRRTRGIVRERKA